MIGTSSLRSRSVQWKNNFVLHKHSCFSTLLTFYLRQIKHEGDNIIGCDEAHRKVFYSQSMRTHNHFGQ